MPTRWIGSAYPDWFVAEFRSIEQPDSDDCWLWDGPIGGNGYGVFRSGGLVSNSHRVSYAAYVQPPPATLYVRHECDTPACWKPSCLCIGTQQDNIDDAVRRGRVCHSEGRAVKLTSHDAREIFTAYHAGVSISILCARYGLSTATVHGIACKKLWRRATAELPSSNLTRAQRTLRGAASPVARYSDKIVADIRRQVASGAKQKDIVAVYGISQSQVSRIVTGQNR